MTATPGLRAWRLARPVKGSCASVPGPAIACATAEAASSSGTSSASRRAANTRSTPEARSSATSSGAITRPFLNTPSRCETEWARMAPSASPTAISPNFIAPSDPQRGGDLGDDRNGDLGRPARPDRQPDRAVDALEIGLAEAGGGEPLAPRPLGLFRAERPDIEAPRPQR